MIMVIGPHRRAPERKATQAPAQARPVPSPRSEASAPAAPAETTVEDTATVAPAETSPAAPTDA